MSAISRELDRPPSGSAETAETGRRASRSSPSRRRRSLVGGIGAVAVASAVLAGCSGGRSALPVAQTPAPSSTVAAPPSSPSNAGAGTSAPIGSGSRTGPVGSRSGSSGGSKASLPFVADTKPEVSTASAGTPLLISVTKESRTGYRRYVFEFTNNDPEGHSPLMATRPPWDVAYVPPAQAVMDASGEPVPHGNVVLRIHFKASMHTDDGRSSLRRSVGDEDALVFGGDFEGNVT